MKFHKIPERQMNRENRCNINVKVLLALSFYKSIRKDIQQIGKTPAHVFALLRVPFFFFFCHSDIPICQASRISNIGGTALLPHACHSIPGEVSSSNHLCVKVHFLSHYQEFPSIVQIPFIK